MPSYRFCRPDDIPSLVEGVRRCFEVHHPPSEPMTVERFRAEMKSHDVWPSNSLLAWEEDRPVAVLIGTKRPDEVQVRRIGVAPDAMRRGHGGHLLTSLSQKLAVLGPPRLVAEIPEDAADAVEFFRSCDYRVEAVWTDWVHSGGPVREIPAELVAQIPVEELLTEGLVRPRQPWDCQEPSFRQQAAELEGWAAVGLERLEAGLVTAPSPAGRRILSWGAAAPLVPDSRSLSFLGLVVLAALRSPEGKTRFEKLSEGELPETWLRGLGFEPDQRHLLLGAKARPA